MTPELKARLEAYTPQIDEDLWKRTRPLILILIRRSEPDSVRWLMTIGAAVAGHVSWAETKRIPLEEENLLDEQVLEWFLSDAEFNTDSTADTYASALRRVLRGGKEETVPASRRHLVAPPYTSVETAQLLSLPGFQPTEMGRVRIESMIRLGLGAGAEPGEQRHARPEDVYLRYGQVHVTLTEPDGTQRPVTVLASHGPRLVVLAEKAKELGMAYMVSGNGDPRYSNNLAHLRKKINGIDGAPELKAARLRTTWQVSHLRARTPLDILLKASGDKTVARLAELVRYVPSLEDEVVAEILAKAEGET